jgi:hypothetical protein
MRAGDKDRKNRSSFLLLDNLGCREAFAIFYEEFLQRPRGIRIYLDSLCSSDRYV